MEHATPTDLLKILLALPILVAGLVAALGPQKRELIRLIALGSTLVTLVISIILAFDFASDPLTHSWKDGVESAWIPSTFHPLYITDWKVMSLGQTGSVIRFFIGLDGMSVWLVLLTAVLMVPSVLISWEAIHERSNEYYAWMLVLQTAMTGVFVSFDIILFYVFFEMTLVPLFFLIGIWGGPEKRYAARKFFIYTLTGSLITLLGMLGMVAFVYAQTNKLTFSIPELVQLANTLYRRGDALAAGFFNVQYWVFLAMLVGFAVKVPLVPVHTWLPLAHVEAPTAGSVLLAGVLLKLGTYGFLRLCLPLTPDACYSIGVPLIGTLAVIGIIYGAVCALAQDDIKKLVAYSSVSHLGFCMLGIFAFNVAGYMGGVLQMINHGLSTGGLFLLVGMLYERYHTRLLDKYSGMGAKLKLLTCFMVFICLSSAGLPGLNGFIGEVFVFFGIFKLRPGFAVLATAGVVLGAWYLLYMLLRVFFGPLKEPELEGSHHAAIGDLNGREWAIIAPVAVLCLALGLYPQPVINSTEGTLQIVGKITHQAELRAAAHQTSLALREREQLAAHVPEGENAR